MKYFLYNFQLFMLVLMRMLGLFAVSPFFSSPMIKTTLRVMIAFLVTIVIFPLVGTMKIVIPDNLYFYFLLVAMEVIIGLIIGFLASVFFAIFQMSGQYFSMLMGLGISEVLDPLTQVQIPVVGQMLTLTALLVFFSIHGEHLLLSALVQSYHTLPILNFVDPRSVSLLTKHFMTTFSQLFFLSMKLALPIMGTMIVLMVSLGLLSKAAPQMNILMVGFPLQLAVGYVSLVIIAPLFGKAVYRVFEIMNSNILTLVSLWKS